MPAGFTIKGIEPFELRNYPDSVKLMYWGWVATLVAQAKDSDLAQGFDAFGEPLRPISAKTRKYRKSAMGPADPYNPPLTPAGKLSRTRSLFAVRALVDRVEAWWRFDPFTHASWSKILTYQQEQGRDVFGLSPQATEWVQQRALGNWRAWLRAGAVIPTELEGKKIAPPMKATGTTGPVAEPAAMPGRPIGPTAVFGIGKESAAGLKPGKWSGGFTEKELKSYLTQKAPANVQGRPGEYNRLLGHIWGQPPRPEPFSPVQPIVPKPKPPGYTSPGAFRLPVRGTKIGTPAEPIGRHLPSDAEIAKPFPKPKPPPKPKLPQPPASPETVTEIKALGGSTGAKLVKDKGGKLWVMKKEANAGHLREEAHADNLYRIMGVAVPRSAIRDTAAGPVKFSEFHDGKTLGQLKLDDPAAYAAAVEKLKQHFVADALLGNWDVIGTGADNILVTAAGDVLRIDNGGALRYRATGGLKSANQWQAVVTELSSLRDASINPAAAKVFGSVTDDEIKAQIKALLSKRAAILKAAPDELRGMLGQRLDSLKQFGKAPKAVKVGNWKPAPEDQFRKLDPGKLSQWEKDNYRDWQKSLSPAEKSAVHDYTSNGFRELNKYLRGARTTPPTNANIVPDLDRALARGAPKEGLVVYRGTDPQEWLKNMGLSSVSQLRPGMDIPDKAYTSTSPVKGSAWSGTKLEIRVPAGTPGAYVNAISSHTTENEFILGREADTFRIVEVKPDIIVVEALQSTKLKKGRKKP